MSEFFLVDFGQGPCHPMHHCTKLPVFTAADNFHCYIILSFCIGYFERSFPGYFINSTGKIFPKRLIVNNIFAFSSEKAHTSRSRSSSAYTISVIFLLFSHHFTLLLVENFQFSISNFQTISKFKFPNVQNILDFDIWILDLFAIWCLDF